MLDLATLNNIKSACDQNIKSPEVAILWNNNMNFNKMNFALFTLVSYNKPLKPQYIYPIIHPASILFLETCHKVF